MIEFLSTFIVQSVFLFVLDHKYRMMHTNNINAQLMFQGFIATMYVIVIPLLAKGSVFASIGYIAGSIFGSYLSYRMHHRKTQKE